MNWPRVLLCVGSLLIAQPAIGKTFTDPALCRKVILFRIYHRTPVPVRDRAFETVLNVHNYLEDSKDYWFAE